MLAEANTGSCFIPALVVPEAGGALPAPDLGRMEIVVHGGCRVIVGADVDAAALARVLAVLEGRFVRRPVPPELRRSEGG
jgi:transposase